MANTTTPEAKETEVKLVTVRATVDNLQQEVLKKVTHMSLWGFKFKKQKNGDLVTEMSEVDAKNFVAAKRVVIVK